MALLPIGAFLLALLWTGVAALACLPNATMTRAEMAVVRRWQATANWLQVSTLAGRQKQNAQHRCDTRSNCKPNLATCRIRYMGTRLVDQRETSHFHDSTFCIR
jgi:hypothetical protein